MDSIKISIITPIYNRESLVSHLVQSVQTQTYENWELILVDDGSTDHTGERCLEFAKEDLRIRYIHKPNGGVCTARNCGIDNATGEYILFLDSDNALFNNTLSVIASRVNDYPQAAFLCFGYGSSSGSWRPCEGENPIIVQRESIRKDFLAQHLNIAAQESCFLKNFVWNKCYKRDFLNEYKIRFDEKRRTWEDGQFIVNCLDHAKELVLIQDVLYDDSCPYSAEHLSARFFDDQIPNYIADEEDYYKRFNRELNFDSEHYCKSNFDVLNMLFSRLVRKNGSNSIDIIERAICKELVIHWARNVEPCSRFEKRVRNTIIKGNAGRLYKLYRLQQIKSAVKGILYRIAGKSDR